MQLLITNITIIVKTFAIIFDPYCFISNVYTSLCCCQNIHSKEIYFKWAMAKKKEVQDTLEEALTNMQVLITELNKVRYIAL